MPPKIRAKIYYAPKSRFNIVSPHFQIMSVCFESDEVPLLPKSFIKNQQLR